MQQLGSGLSAAKRHEDALSVKEADLSMRRRLGDSEEGILVARSNLAVTYTSIGRFEEALRTERDVYSGRMKLNGEEHERTLRVAYNYSSSLISLKRFEEAKSLVRKTLPVARRILGESYGTTLRMRLNYAQWLCDGPGATLEDLREAATTIEEIERTARRVFGGSHPLTVEIERFLHNSRARLAARPV